jgi:dTDP-4-dehydrorhamnose 3,5-epimerase
MEFESTAIPDVMLVRPKVFDDERGSFIESWDARQFSAVGLPSNFSQEISCRWSRNTLRGLHYQVRHPTGKLVRVIAGTVFEVAVDIRRGSSTRGRWVGALLSGQNHHALWIPPGFAHGFLVLSESAHFLCSSTALWTPATERAILWNDPDLSVAWPLLPGEEPVLSAKDAAATRIREAEYFS